MARKQTKPRYRGRFSKPYKRKAKSTSTHMLTGGYQGKEMKPLNVQRVIYNVAKTLMRPRAL